MTWLAYAGYYVVRQAFSVAKLGILDDPSVNGVLTEHALGMIDAVYLAAYAVGQFLWGTWADRFGPRVVVIGGMIGAVAAAVLLGVSSAVLVFGGAMVLMGLAQSTGWASLCKNVVAFFPLHERGRVLGLWCSSYAFGGLVAPPFLGWCAYSLFDDWRVAFFAAAATLSVVLLLFVVFQRTARRTSDCRHSPGRTWRISRAANRLKPPFPLRDSAAPPLDDTERRSTSLRFLTHAAPYSARMGPWDFTSTQRQAGSAASSSTARAWS